MRPIWVEPSACTHAFLLKKVCTAEISCLVYRYFYSLLLPGSWFLWALNRRSKLCDVFLWHFSASRFYVALLRRAFMSHFYFTGQQDEQDRTTLLDNTWEPLNSTFCKEKLISYALSSFVTSTIQEANHQLMDHTKWRDCQIQHPRLATFHHPHSCLQSK